MKRIVVSSLLLGLLVVPLVSSAALFQKGENSYTHPQNDLVRENLYAVAPSVSVAGPVQGDAFLAGGMISVTGSVSQDVALVGGTVNVLSRIQEDVRAIGGNIAVGDRVGGDAILVGGTVLTTSDAVIGGDVVIIGGQVTVNGVLNRDLTVLGGEVVINGTVLGNVSVRADKKVVIGETAVIRGDFEYKARKEAVIETGARIDGDVVKTASKWDSVSGTLAYKKTVAGIITSLILLKILALFIAYLILSNAMRRFTGHVIKDAQHDFWKQFITGLVVAIVVPIAAAIIGFTIIGLPFTILLLAGYVVLITLSALYVGPVLGAALMRLLKKDYAPLTWWAALLGIVVFVLLRFVPLIGWAVDCVFMLLTVGTLAQMWYEHTWKKR